LNIGLDAAGPIARSIEFKVLIGATPRELSGKIAVPSDFCVAQTGFSAQRSSKPDSDSVAQNDQEGGLNESKDAWNAGQVTIDKERTWWARDNTKWPAGATDR